jgi:hypothetical protein
MHALEDMRVITYGWNITNSVGRVDARGLMTVAERTVTIGSPIPQAAWLPGNPQHQCLEGRDIRAALKERAGQ